jgi:ribosomal protein S18 acetylase RimI-like enzyme
VILREATASDYEAICDLQHDSDVYHTHHLPTVWQVPDEPHDTREDFASVLANDNCLVLVAEHEGEVVGYIDASVQRPTRPDEAGQPWCSINNVVVKCGRRRQGIGSMLLRAAEAWACEKGLAQVRLEVFEFNARARVLYKRLGYDTISRQMGKALADGM